MISTQQRIPTQKMNFSATMRLPNIATSTTVSLVETVQQSWPSYILLLRSMHDPLRMSERLGFETETKSTSRSIRRSCRNTWEKTLCSGFTDEQWVPQECPHLDEIGWLSLETGFLQNTSRSCSAAISATEPRSAFKYYRPLYKQLDLQVACRTDGCLKKVVKVRGHEGGYCAGHWCKRLPQIESKRERQNEGER